MELVNYVPLIIVMLALIVVNPGELKSL